MQSVRLPESLQRKLNLDRAAGVIVLSMETGGPAERAGVLIGDVLLSLGGQPVGDTMEVQHALGEQLVGRSVPVTIVRGGELVALEIAPGERPHRSR